LGSATVALDASGNAQAVTLYAPYGTTRYSSGTMPGSDGYTGQHADAATGLDDDGARSYDPAAGQFTSADTLLAGLNRYGYVGGDPENATDPTGHACDSLEFSSCLAPTGEGTAGPSAFRSGMRGYTLDPDYQDPAPAGTTGPPPLPSVPDPYPGLGVGGGYGPRTQPPGDDLQPFNQRTWAAARAAVDESNPLGPTENQQNLPKPTPPPPGPTPPSPSPGPTSTLTGGGSGDAPPGAPPAPPGDGCDDGGANPNTVTVYRVQGGGPTGSKPRIKIRFGKVLISGRDMLFLNFGNTERAMELLARRSAGGPAQIVAFEVAAEFVQWLRDNAVPEAVSKQFPGSPIAVDLNDGDQFGLPSTLFRRLFENMVPGSGHVLPNEETC
jgi:RHS repeat-associated protein